MVVPSICVSDMLADQKQRGRKAITPKNGISYRINVSITIVDGDDDRAARQTPEHPPMSEKVVQSEYTVPQPLEPAELPIKTVRRENESAGRVIRSPKRVIHQDRSAANQAPPCVTPRESASDSTPVSVRTYKTEPSGIPALMAKERTHGSEKPRRNVQCQEQASEQDR